MTEKLKKDILKIFKKNRSKILFEVKNNIQQRFEPEIYENIKNEVPSFTEKVIEIFIEILSKSEYSKLDILVQTVFSQKENRVFSTSLILALLLCIKEQIRKILGSKIKNISEFTEFSTKLDLICEEILFKFMLFSHTKIDASIKEVEYALKLSETRYKELFDHMNTGVVIYEATKNGTDFIIRNMNNASEKMEKVKREDVIGKSVLKIFPSVKEFGLLSVFQKVWKTGKSQIHPVNFYKDKRLSVWRENYVYKLPSGRIVAVYDDVTEKKKAEDVIKGSEKQLRSILDSMNDMIHLVDRDLKILFINNSFKLFNKKLGFNPSPVGKNIKQIYPFLNKNVLKEYETIFSTGNTLITEETNVIGNQAIDTETLKIPIIEREEVVKVITIIRDITKKKKTENELRESEEKYRLLVENANDGIAIIQEMSFVYVNKNLSNILGYSIKEILKTELIKYLNPDEISFFIDKFQNGRNEQTVQFESVILNKSGKKIYADINITPIKFLQKPANLMFIRDITESKRFEQELINAKEKTENSVKALKQREEELTRLLKLKDQFVSLVSHDLKVPFQSILGYASLLSSDESFPEKSRKYLVNIQEAAHAQLEYIDKLLNMAYLESGKFELQITPEKLSDIVNDVYRYFYFKIKKKKLNFKIDIPETIILKVDRSLFSQVLNNLINNAIKFTRSGGNISVSAYIEDSSSMISISDSGVGIKDEDKINIFSEFSKHYTKGTDGEKGSGLGLSISKKILDAHGFKIDVVSKMNEGTTFKITVPN
ncbi:MAG: PAS domain S-box protein [bacterium]|nr:PAS domain S-box protein [bacterium]